MVKISEAYSTKKVELPSYKGSEVNIKTAISVEKIIELEGTAEDKDLEKVLNVVVALIVSWNFETEEGKPLEITVDNLKKFPNIDLQFLSEEITKIVKKKQPEKTS